MTRMSDDNITFNDALNDDDIEHEWAGTLHCMTCGEAKNAYEFIAEIEKLKKAVMYFKSWAVNGKRPDGSIPDYIMVALLRDSDDA